MPSFRELGPQRFLIRPCDPESGQRVPPSMLEDYQMTHHFLSPCCLCAFLDAKDYVEASIGIIQEARPDSGEATSFLNGQYVAICAKRRCGYIRVLLCLLPSRTTDRSQVCFERFYSNPGIKLQYCPKRCESRPNDHNHASASLPYTNSKSAAAERAQHIARAWVSAGSMRRRTASNGPCFQRIAQSRSEENACR